MSTIKTGKLGELIEGKYYTISFEFFNQYSTNMPQIFEIKILIKLENSIKIFFVNKNTSEWFQTSKICSIYDEIPIKYFRKEKLEKLMKIK